MAWLILALYTAVAIALIWKYFRTRGRGLLWLGAALILFPVASMLLGREIRILIDRTIQGQPVMFPFSLVESEQIALGSLVYILDSIGQVVRLALFFIAVLHLCRPGAVPRRQPAD